MENKIVLFENQNIRLEVNLKDETVWLTLDQMAELFQRDKSVISRHIKNAMAEELDNSTVAKFATVQKEGSRNVTRDIDYYNLDMIISVGYRVKSQNGIVFRRWANKVLKDYLLNGYAVNEKRLAYLEKTVKLIDIASRIEEEVKGKRDINRFSNELFGFKRKKVISLLFFYRYLFNSLVNSVCNSFNLFSVFASKRIVMLGPVLDALTKAKPSSNLHLTPSIVR